MAIKRLVRYCGLLTLLSICPVALFAQSASPPPRPDTIRADKSSPTDDGPPLTTLEEEMRAKRERKYAEKEHRENLARATEISDLGKELAHAFKQKRLIDREDLKKLDRLEKLTKKVRGEAGGEDTEVTLDRAPSDLGAAFARIGECAISVGEKVKQTPRQVISAGVIDEANVLLELIRRVRNLAH